MEKKQKSSRLSERFVLVHFTSHGWDSRKRDRQLSDETARQQNAEADAVDTFIKLIPSKEFAGIKQAHGLAYREFCNKTIPYMAGGIRLLAADDIMDWRVPVTKAIHQHAAEVEKFVVERWPELSTSQKMQKRLGKLSGRYKLPTAADLRRRFGITLDMYPVPEPSDFRAKLTRLADDEADEIRAEVTQSLQDTANRAMSQVWKQLGVFVKRISDTMSEPDKGFRDSLLTNLQGFCEMLPKYNITQDPELEAVRQAALAQLANLDAADLKEIPIKRKKAADDAKKLLDRINQYI